MCYNWQSSIVSFFVGTTCSLYLLQQKDKYLKHAGFFFVAVCLMQLIEFFMWMDQDCGWLNHLSSKFLVVVLILQVYALYFGGFIFDTIQIRNFYHPVIMVLVLLWGLYYIFQSVFLQQNYLCSKKGTKLGLEWDWGVVDKDSFKRIYYYFFIFIPLLLMLRSHIWLFITILGQLFYFYTEKDPSYWCFYSAGIPLILSIFLLLKKKM